MARLVPRRRRRPTAAGVARRSLPFRPGSAPKAGPDAPGDAATDRTALAATRVAAGDDRTRYDDFAVALHWLTVLPVLAQFGLAELWDFAARPTRHAMIVAHMSFGILPTLVLVVRVAWRLTPGHRVRPAASGWVELASEAVHYLLCGLLATEAVLGFVPRWSGNEAMSSLGLPIPPRFAPFPKAAHHLVGAAHDIVGWTIIVVAAGHAAAALFHHFRPRDDVLWRMLPGRRTRREEARAPSPERAARTWRAGVVGA